MAWLWEKERTSERKSQSRRRSSLALAPLYFSSHPTPMQRRETFLSYKLLQHSTDPASHPREKEEQLVCLEEKCVVIIGKCQINVLRSIFSNLFAFTTWSMLFRGLYPQVYPLLCEHILIPPLLPIRQVKNDVYYRTRSSGNINPQRVSWKAKIFDMRKFFS